MKVTGIKMNDTISIKYGSYPKVEINAKVIEVTKLEIFFKNIDFPDVGTCMYLKETLNGKDFEINIIQ